MGNFRLIVWLLVIKCFLNVTSFSWGKDYNEFAPDPNTVALYHFNEGKGLPQDSSNRGNHSTVNKAKWVKDGRFGFAISEGPVIVPTSNSLQPPQITIEAWVKAEQVGNYARIIDRYGVRRGYRLLIDRNTGALHALFAVATIHGTVEAIVVGKERLPLGKWTYVAVTYDGNYIRLYQNGIEVGNKKISGKICYCGDKTPLQIGARSNGKSSFIGVIDEVRISDVARDRLIKEMAVKLEKRRKKIIESRKEKMDYYKKLDAYIKKEEALYEKDNMPLIFLHWRVTERTPLDEGIKIAKETGCNAIWLSAIPAPNLIKRLKDAGFITMANHGAWPTLNPEWIRIHPEHRPQRYVVSAPVMAKSKEPLIIELKNACTKGNPKKYWYVYCKKGNLSFLQDDWEFNSAGKKVIINNPEEGNVYYIKYLVYSPLPYASPIYPEFHQGAVEQLNKWLSRYTPYLDYFLADCVGLPKVHPYIYEYVYDCSPYAQEKFQADTGIKFNPDWVLENFMRLRQGLPSRAPSQEYLSWVEWHVKQSKKFLPKIKKVCHKHKVKVMAYTWGDAWIGAEPYLVSDNFDAIDSFGPNMAMAGLRSYFPHLKRICQSWFYTNPFGPLHNWNKNKKILLYNMLDGYLWGGLPDRNIWKNQEVINEIKNANNEFKLLWLVSRGKEAFKHNITLYVINSWGKIRSWKGPETQFLFSLPIKIKFISITEISKNGVPADADVLLNWGDPNTPWSGGYMWTFPNVIERISAFVKNGGGFVGVGAPAYFKTKDSICQLKELLGIEYKSEKKVSSILKALKTSLGTNHWISNDLPQEISFASQITELIQTDIGDEKITSMRYHVISVPLKKDLQILYQAKQFSSPLVSVRNFGKGRVVYIGGVGTSSDYRNLIGKSIFWAAGKEKLFYAMFSPTPEIYLSFYPNTNTLLVYNGNANHKEASIKIDFSKLLNNTEGRKDFYLYDIINRKKIVSSEPSHLFRISLPPYTIYALKIVPLERREDTINGST
ncbi:hypothetical protein J7M02_07445 [Candidatus Aerophobetes bacterium]|nr:hypothetical protein [Candidatus Aerophobetes bacterium]